MLTLGEWFCLRGERLNFAPDTVKDREVLFCHDEVQSDIQDGIEKAYATGATVKMLLYGDWGVGKTHSLRHLEYWLANHASEFPAFSVFVEIGDVYRKSNFSVIHRDLIDGVGLNKARELVFGFLQHSPDIMAGLRSIGVPDSIGSAFSKLLAAPPGTTPPPVVTTSWEYLRGINVGKDGIDIGLPSRLTDSKDFYYVLQGFGHLFKVVDCRQLIFLVDEASKLEAVGVDQEVTRHWINVNKMIFDQNNRYFGFVYTVSARAVDDVPQALYDPQIENRLGDRKYELKNLDAASVEVFLRRLVDKFVDRNRVEQNVTSGVIRASEYNWDSYPFIEQGLSRFVDYFERTQENSKPRDIAGKLDDAGFKAMKRGKRLIDEEILGSMNL